MDNPSRFLPSSPVSRALAHFRFVAGDVYGARKAIVVTTRSHFLQALIYGGGDVPSFEVPSSGPRRSILTLNSSSSGDIH